jgi:hypothetical protein
MRDASNLPMDELLTPEVVSEKMEIELAELGELEAAINDAEEEELWSLTLAAQLKHLQVRGEGGWAVQGCCLRSSVVCTRILWLHINFTSALHQAFNVYTLQLYIGFDL